MSTRQEAIEIVRVAVMRWPLSFRREVALRQLELAECAVCEAEAVRLIQGVHIMLQAWRRDHIYRNRHGG